MSNQNIIEVGFNKKTQPVRIGGVDLEIDVGSKGRARIYEIIPNLINKIDEIENKKKLIVASKNFEDISEIDTEYGEAVEEAVNLVFGKGSYEKLYEAANGEVDAIAEALIEVLEQYKKLQTKQKAHSYIDGKKK